MLSLTRDEFSLRAKLQSKFYEHVLSRSGFINANWIYLPWTWSAVNKRRITSFPVIFRELSRGLPSSQRFVKIWWHRSTEAGESMQWMAERRRSVNKTRTWLIIYHFQYLEIYHSEYSIYFRVSITCYFAKILHLLDDFFGHILHQCFGSSTRSVTISYWSSVKVSPLLPPFWGILYVRNHAFQSLQFYTIKSTFYELFFERIHREVDINQLDIHRMFIFFIAPSSHMDFILLLAATKKISEFL